MSVGRPETAPRTIALVAHGVHDDGGMERAYAELVRRMPSRYRAIVISSELAPSLRPLVEWRHVPVPRRPVPLRILLFFVLGGIALRRIRPDLIHTLGAIVPNRADAVEVQFCDAGFLAATGRFAPMDAPPLRRINTALARVLALSAERWCYKPRRLRQFVAVSHGIGSELARHYPGIPVVVAPNGVDLVRFKPDAAFRRRIRDQVGLGDADVVALFVGGDWDRKGLPIAIAALAHAAGVHLWVVGPGDTTRFEKLAREHGVGARVRFFGRRADTERFYAAADIFCLPSLYEAYPLAGLEAAAAGLPVVATPVNGISDLVGEDEAGILVQRAPKDVGEALARLACDSALRKRLGSAARRRVEHYTWDASHSDRVSGVRRTRARKERGRTIVIWEAGVLEQRSRYVVHGLGLFALVIVASVLVARLAVSPTSLRLAVVFVAASFVAGLAFRAPRGLLIVLVGWLAALGLLRRIVTQGSTATGTDFLLLVGPLALVALFLVAAKAGAFERLTTLSKSVIALSAVALLGAFNPLQGGLHVGLGGVLLLMIPMLSFWVGRALVDDRLLRLVLLVVAGLAVPAAAYGLWQTFAGFPAWDSAWIADSNFVALNINDTVRPFSSFSSPAEFGFYLTVAIGVWLCFGLSLGRLPVTVPIVTFLGVALVYESARLVALLLVAALGIAFAAHRGVRPPTALISGAVALVLVSLVASRFAVSASPGQASSLVAHQVQGIADPFGSQSTGPGHLSQLVDGVTSAFTHPAGAGTGAVTQAAKLGGNNYGAESDPSNAAVGLGLPGLIAYLCVAISGFLAVYRAAARRRDALATAALIVVLATALTWLNGGQYAIAFLPWLILGWADRPEAIGVNAGSDRAVDESPA